jgi:methyl-accepting chemotaxis protein
MRISVRSKLFLGFGAVVALGLVLGIVATLSMGSMNHDTTAVTENDLPTVQLVGDVATAAGHYRSDQFEVVSAPTAASRARYVARLHAAEGAVAANFRALQPLLTTAADRADFARASRDWSAYVAHTPDFVREASTGRADAALATLGGTTRADFEQLAATLTGWSTASRQAADTSAHRAKRSYRSALDLTIALIALSALLGAAVAWFVSRIIVNGTSRCSARRRGSRRATSTST